MSLPGLDASADGPTLRRRRAVPASREELDHAAALLAEAAECGGPAAADGTFAVDREPTERELRERAAAEERARRGNRISLLRRAYNRVCALAHTLRLVVLTFFSLLYTGRAARVCNFLLAGPPHWYKVLQWQNFRAWCAETSHGPRLLAWLNRATSALVLLLMCGAAYLAYHVAHAVYVEPPPPPGPPALLVPRAAHPLGFAFMPLPRNALPVACNADALAPLPADVTLVPDLTLAALHALGSAAVTRHNYTCVCAPMFGAALRYLVLANGSAGNAAPPLHLYNAEMDEPEAGEERVDSVEDWSELYPLARATQPRLVVRRNVIVLRHMRPASCGLPPPPPLRLRREQSVCAQQCLDMFAGRSLVAAGAHCDARCVQRHVVIK